MPLTQITLKAARVNSGLTLVEAAELLGINQSNLSRYENGKNEPDIATINAMLDLYGLKYEQINFLRD